MININFVKKLKRITNVRFNEDMSKHCSFKLGGKVFCFCEPLNIKELKKIVKLCEKFGIPYFIIGKGSNLVFRDIYNGVVISLKYFCTVKNKKNLVYVESGVGLFSLNMFLRENSLSGLEFSFGIPGSVGGAIYMNAGAYGKEIKDYIKSVTYLKNGKLITKNIQDLDFSYRYSQFQNSKNIIISAVLNLQFGQKEDIIYLQNDFFNRRKLSQPLNYPSAGSVFKRQENIIPAKLIDDLGLKGTKVGGVEVSTKHSGFIVNINNGSVSDLEKLIELIKEEVYKKYGINMQTEIIFIGENYEINGWLSYSHSL